MIGAIDFSNEDLSILDTFVDEKVRERVSAERTRDGICSVCGLQMLFAGSNYQCDLCGIETAGEIESDKSESTGGSRRMQIGGRQRVFNTGGDVSHTQRKALLEDLNRKNTMYAHAGKTVENGVLVFRPAIPTSVIHDVANTYNLLQQTPITKAYGEKTVASKFMHRGDVRAEILAALIYYKCLKHGHPRKRQDCARLMDLQNYGFARGESILRRMVALKYVNMEFRDDDPRPAAEALIERLDMNIDHADFVVELVERCIDLQIGSTCLITSKVAGAIWILICHCGLPITSQQVEVAADSTKKNTFNKFSRAVTIGFSHVEDIFIKHAIPLKSKIVARKSKKNEVLVS